jgi:hypothetical protein
MQASEALHAYHTHTEQAPQQAHTFSAKGREGRQVRLRSVPFGTGVA